MCSNHPVSQSLHHYPNSLPPNSDSLIDKFLSLIVEMRVPCLQQCWIQLFRYIQIPHFYTTGGPRSLTLALMLLPYLYFRFIPSISIFPWKFIYNLQPVFYSSLFLRFFYISQIGEKSCVCLSPSDLLNIRTSSSNSVAENYRITTVFVSAQYSVMCI